MVILVSLRLVALPKTGSQPAWALVGASLMGKLGSASCPSAEKPVQPERSPPAEEGTETRVSGAEPPSLHTSLLEGKAGQNHLTSANCSIFRKFVSCLTSCW